MGNNSFDSKKISDKLSEINEKEPEMAMALGMLVNHVHGTYSDKYAKGVDNGIDTKAMLYSKDNGRGINQYQIARYLQRYTTNGSRKSGLLIDLFKMCHYALFETIRRIKNNELDSTEPKV